MQDFSINVSICQDLDPPGGETDPPSSGGDSGTDEFFQLNLWTKRVLNFFLGQSQRCQVSGCRFVPSLKLTYPLNIFHPCKRRFPFGNPSFLGAFAVSFREGRRFSRLAAPEIPWKTLQTESLGGWPAS